MDPNLLTQNPLFRNKIKKIALLIFILLALEIGGLVAMSYLIGFNYVFWITIGFILIGYAIKPDSSSNKNLPQATRMLPRKLASTLFMIPGFFTDLAAFLILIPPVRNFFTNRFKKKFLPPGMADMFNGDMYSQLNQNLNLDGMNPDFSKFNDFKSKKSKKSSNKRRQNDDIIDIDYEVQNGTKRTASYDDVQTSAAHSQPKALEAEILDVPYEWTDDKS